MRLKPLCVFLLLCGLFPAKASADNRFIVRTTLGLQGLQTVCNPLLLTPICTVIGSGLGDPQGQLFTITTPLALNDLLALPGNLLGIVDAEVDQLVSLFPIGSLNVLPSASAGYLTPLMSDRTLVPYPASSGRTSACNGLSPCVWDAYANQPAARIVRVSDAQSQFGVTGAGIVADIDTGVDPTHHALQGVLLPGCDFTHNQPDGSCQPGGSELTDISFSPPPPCQDCSAAQVNQSTAAVLDQSTAAVLDCNGATPCQYAA